MSIATELTLLANSKQAIKDSINAKGGNITSSTPFADYADEIDNLPSGGGSTHDWSSIGYDSTMAQKCEDAIDDQIEYAQAWKIAEPTYAGGQTDYKGQYYPMVNVNTTTMNRMFNNCIALTSVPALDTSNVTNMNQMFYNCTALTSVPALDTSKVTNMYQMFYNCTALTSVPALDTSKVTNMSMMFNNCTALTSVPALDTSKVTNMNMMFYNCRNLKSVSFSSTTPPVFGEDMFVNTNNNFKIYVTASSVESYKSATGWSDFASSIYPLTDIATVDNTLYTNADLAITSTTTITDTDLAKIPAGTSIEFAEGLTEISAGTLSWTNITLPSTFTSLGDSGMIDSTVTTLTMKSTTPPGAFRNNVGGSGLTAIYVPASSISDYKDDANWSSFSSIIQAIPE